MVKRIQTDIYLKEFDSLTEALYLCWHNSFCFATKQLNKEILNEQICSYGFYRHKKEERKELPLSFRNKLKFKTLIWINKFTDVIAEDSFYEYNELYKKVIKEIESNLFMLTNEAAKITYAKIILCDIDKSHIHNQQVDKSIRDFRYKEMFEHVLSHNFISADQISYENSCAIYPNYDLTVRLINHFDFIDKLIELFNFFDINLILLAKKYSFNLYIFNEDNIEVNFPIELDNKILPKFNSLLSDDCLIKIMQYFSHKKMLDHANSDVWLFWFNRKYIKVPEPLKWNGSPSMLSNVIQHVCGESISNTIKTAFCAKEYIKPTKNKYEHSKMHKEIEQIITISKQKNN